MIFDSAMFNQKSPRKIGRRERREKKGRGRLETKTNLSFFKDLLNL